MALLTISLKSEYPIDQTLHRTTLKEADDHVYRGIMKFQPTRSLVHQILQNFQCNKYPHCPTLTRTPSLQWLDKVAWRAGTHRRHHHQAQRNSLFMREPERKQSNLHLPWATRLNTTAVVGDVESGQAAALSPRLGPPADRLATAREQAGHLVRSVSNACLRRRAMTAAERAEMEGTRRTPEASSPLSIFGVRAGVEVVGC